MSDHTTPQPEHGPTRKPLDAEGKAAERREVARVYAAKRRKELKAKGFCGSCLRRPQRPGRTLCEHCLAVTKARRVRLNGQGICQCGLRPIPEGKSCCERCRQCYRDSEAKKLRRRRGNGLCGKCAAPCLPGYTRCEACRQKDAAKRLALRREVFDAYGGPRCVCRGTTFLEHLTIDHTDNDGAAHRRELGASKGYAFYRKLKHLGFPQTPRMTVMCFNCNLSRNCFGYCPCRQSE